MKPWSPDKRLVYIRAGRDKCKVMIEENFLHLTIKSMPMKNRQISSPGYWIQHLATDWREQTCPICSPVTLPFYPELTPIERTAPPLRSDDCTTDMEDGIASRARLEWQWLRRGLELEPAAVSVWTQPAWMQRFAEDVPCWNTAFMSELAAHFGQTYIIVLILDLIQYLKSRI